jgi:hypothetical protein
MKTRLQLQGELQKADSNAPRVYKNALDVFVKTWRNEGIKGLQRGLFPAVSLGVRNLGRFESGGAMNPRGGHLLSLPRHPRRRQSLEDAGRTQPFFLGYYALRGRGSSTSYLREPGTALTAVRIPNPPERIKIRLLRADPQDAQQCGRSRAGSRQPVHGALGGCDHGLYRRYVALGHSA